MTTLLAVDWDGTTRFFGALFEWLPALVAALIVLIGGYFLVQVGGRSRNQAHRPGRLRFRSRNPLASGGRLETRSRARPVAPGGNDRFLAIDPGNDPDRG
jgi:hypothetical protein